MTLNRDVRITLISTMAVIALLLLAYFVWPTPWNYYSADFRIGRWNNKAQVFHNGHWGDVRIYERMEAS